MSSNSGVISIKRHSGDDIKIFGDGQSLVYDINRELDMVACRGEFNQAVDQIADHLDRRIYLQLFLTERNTLRPGVWEDYLNIKMILLMASKYSALEVYTNSGAVFDFFAGKDALVTIADRFGFFLKKNLLRCKQFLSSIVFMGRILLGFCISRILRRKKYRALASSSIITTWVSDVNFAPNGFIDSYFPGLKESLVQSGEQVVVCPFFYNVKKVFSAHRYMLQRGNFLMVEDCVRITDYWQVLIDFIRKIGIKLDLFVIGEIDMAPGWSWYRLQERPIYSSLFGSFVRELAQRGIGNVKFFINHENLIPEKMLLLACEEFFPKAKVVANFHTTMPFNLLNLDYAGETDFKISPLPDYVLFNSPAYQHYFEERWPELNCRPGYAMKQSYLSSMNISSGRADKISVFLSGRRYESLMILDTLNKNASDLVGYEIIFRFHPMDIFDLKKCCDFTNWSVFDGDISSFLSQSVHVISAYSMCLLEAAIAGKNVGFIYDPTRPLLNPFDNLDVENYSLIGRSSDLISYLSRQSSDLRKLPCEKMFYLKNDDISKYMI